MFGGALTFGALFRYQNRILIWDTLILGLGLIILVNSRPFESFFILIPAACYALYITILWIKKDSWHKVLVQFLLPISAIIFFLFIWLLFYNYHLVGDPFKLPHAYWAPKNSPIKMIQMFQWSPQLPLFNKLLRFYNAFIGPILLITLFSVKSIIKGRETLFALIIAVMLFCISAIATKAWPHYTASIVCLVFLVITKGLIGISTFNFMKRPLGSFLVKAIVVGYIVSSIITYGFKVYDGKSYSWLIRKQRILDKLESDDNKYLIMVRYSDSHNVNKEWVYNRADIDNSDVVWARVLDPLENQKLFRYFKNRKIFLLQADSHSQKLFKIR